MTAVCSARNAELVRSLGAERVIDYAVEDYGKGTARYDLIFDLVGNHSFAATQRVMTPRGICVGAGVLDGPKSLLVMVGGLIATLVRAKFSRHELSTFAAKINREDLTFIGQLLASSKLKSVIDKRYTLNEVPEAVHYQGTWRARGKVVINVCP